MIDNDGPSEAAFEIPLTEQEAILFRDQIVWQAVNLLAGQDFVQAALPGEKLEYSRTVMTPLGPQKVTVEAFCDLDMVDADDLDAEPDRICSARVTVEKLCPEISEELL